MATGPTVWAVRLGTPDTGSKGKLELGPASLSFAPEEEGNHISIPLADITRVRRSPGSPVLIVERTADPVAFYFVEPPPLRFRSETSHRAKGRMRSILYLRERNRTKRDEVRAWVARIREATERAG